MEDTLFGLLLPYAGMTQIRFKRVGGLLATLSALPRTPSDMQYIQMWCTPCPDLCTRLRAAAPLCQERSAFRASLKCNTMYRIGGNAALAAPTVAITDFAQVNRR